MKALVTGCAGFIGSHLSNRLLKEGIDVYGIDAVTDYYDTNIKRRNLQSLSGFRNFRFDNVDINSIDIAKRITDVDVVYHLAAQPGVRASWGTTFDVYLRNNILATQRLLENLKGSLKLKKFVYASSSSVYGQTAVEKVTEDHPTRPFSPYGVTKLAGEHLCSLYAMNYGIPVISMRFFTVYGPSQRPDMAFHQLISAALKGTPFTLYGDGLQERDFTYVSDVVDALVACTHKEEVQGIFNIGGGHVVSLREVINQVEQLAGRKIHVVHEPRQKGDVFKTSADIRRIGEHLGYAPRVSLTEGLRRHIDYVRSISLDTINEAGTTL